MSKFKLPMKFRNDRIMITSETYIMKRKDAGENSRVYDYLMNGHVLDTITVTHEDEKRKEVSIDMNGTIMNIGWENCNDDAERAWWMSRFLHAIHPSLKEEAKRFA